MSTRILVLYYSRHGSTQALARQIARGINSVSDCEALLRTVPDIPPSTEQHSDPYLTLDELKDCDGLAMGSPVWFGNMAAPLKHFWDTTTPLWVSGALIDRPACVFASSSSLHGGQESTLQSMQLPLLHHGMLIVGIPYSEPALHTTQTGGTPYGASHLSGTPGQMSQEEKTLAQQLGCRLATLSARLKNYQCD
ncbi:NAD(P)H:quinone oxidoreductase [Vibrio mangrovi]|uniref:NAD(P)H dehydrogenase (Quinone) n=1 Tax=Vibrio mangrovi TaxID=474394 RepID=A0A1Y6IWL7_9VIBR|nr:NAD(P)H:quinone oxidoreductase [Vibrio mangrovi]MDW6001543.1 NAD(P)H:quinone oxidoreductase [Vibrio mangrovi]SMS00433.1 NAD(P)H dehydrogenase (quinone) [Vibrio mangrovi]